MTGFSMDEDIDSDEEELIMEALNENYKRKYVIDINYNRPLKNFPLTLNMIEEVDETSVKSPESDKSQDENGNDVNTDGRKSSHVAWDSRKEVIPISNRIGGKTRPKSASSAVEDCKKHKERTDKRPRSSCAGYPSRIPVKKNDSWISKSDADCSSHFGNKEGKVEEISKMKKTKHKSEHSLERYGVDMSMESVGGLSEYPDRPTSACCIRAHMIGEIQQGKWQTKRSNSQPDIGKSHSTLSSNLWCDMSRFKRSLRLLGLSNSDFGLPDTPKHQPPPPRPRSHCTSPTFSTRVLQKSYSLDCLKEVVKEAASDPYTGLHHRKILAQAAYEEWYFNKLKDNNKKNKDESEKSQQMIQLMEEENRKRAEKAALKFQNWMDTKRKQEKQRKPSALKAKLENRLIKSREEIDKAYFQWKKHKQQDLSKKKLEKLKEDEKVEREKIQKEEKKIQAEKAFKEWKRKSEEKQKMIKEKEEKAKEKIKEQLTERSKSNIEYQVWKHRKDLEINAQHQKIREAVKQMDDQRSMIVSERLYEAEQAFENWLEKIDNRKTDIINSSHKSLIPWAPS